MSGALDSLGERASLMASTGSITAYLKEHERKSQSQQIGLFDLGGDSFASHDFALAKATPMSYEEKIKGEKAIIGYSVSGHALDGLGRYVRAKTLGMEHIRMYQKLLKEHHEKVFEEELQKAVAAPAHESDMGGDEGDTSNESAPIIADIPMDVSTEEEAPPPLDPPEAKAAPKRDKDAMKKVRCIGLVTAIRRIQTKSGKMMLTASCESHDFRFTITVFPKDYETYVNIIEVDTIAIVEGMIRLDDLRDEMSIIANSVRTLSITSVRRQAEETGLFDPRDKVAYVDVIEDEEETLLAAPLLQPTMPTTSPKETSQPQTYTVDIPTGATKEDLLNFKTFLETVPVGMVSIRINIRGTIIDTKKSVADIRTVAEWAVEYWG